MGSAYDVIAVDMDGTLLTSDKTVSPRTRDALRAERDDGAVLMLASGRPEHGLRHLAQDLGMGLDGLVLASCNGTAVVDAATEEVVVRRTVAPDLVARVMDALEGTGLEAMSPVGEVLWATSDSTYNVHREARLNHMELRIAPRFERVDNLNKILVAGRTAHLAEHLDSIRAALDGHAEVALSAPIYLEVTALGADKGSGLRDYCEAKGVDLARTMAFGDHENDIPMLRSAGIGVAMGNALPHVKEVADRVTLTNDEDGIAVALGR